MGSRIQGFKVFKVFHAKSCAARWDVKHAQESPCAVSWQRVWPCRSIADHQTSIGSLACKEELLES